MAANPIQRRTRDRLAAVHVPRLGVVGSINLDLVVRAEQLPRPGETVAGSGFSRIPGGKGANQAVAAARLGAEVTFVGCVGNDSFADEALTGLLEAGVVVDTVRRAQAPTGVALIVVDEDGENQIVVAPGANLQLSPDDIVLPDLDGVLCQQEIPPAAVERAAELARGRFVLNAAPARPDPPQASLTIVNRYEFGAIAKRRSLVCLTLGADGAVLLEDGKEVARASPPPVKSVDGTAAGDAFSACLVISLLEGRTRQEAIQRACTAGALAASRFGAQTSLPTASEIDAHL
jgi:ribokinase